MEVVGRWFVILSKPLLFWLWGGMILIVEVWYVVSSVDSRNRIGSSSVVRLVITNWSKDLVKLLFLKDSSLLRFSYFSWGREVFRPKLSVYDTPGYRANDDAVSIGI